MIEEAIKSLPINWKIETVGSLYDIVGGGTPSTKQDQYWNGDIPWISSADIHGVKDITPRKKITREAISNSATNLVPAGSIIVVTRVGLGKVAIAPYPLCFSQDSQALIPKRNDIFEHYALYYLSQAVQIFKYHSRGTTISGVTKKQLSELPFPLPPLEEQQRIVARIEELFTQLDAGVAALEAVRAQVRRYRQAVLQAAVTGKLLRKEKTENENGPQVGWRKVKLSEVAEVRLGRQRSPSRATGPNMRFYLRAANVTWNGLNLSDVKQMDFSPKELEIYRLEPNDVLLNEASGSIGEVGKPAIYRGEIEDCCFQNTLLRVRSKGPLPEFLYHHFLHDASNEKFRGLARGVGIHHLGAEGLSNWVISLPPLDQQKAISLEVDRLFSIADHMEKSIDQSLRQAARLRQSILSRAFIGKL